MSCMTATRLMGRARHSGMSLVVEISKGEMKAGIPEVECMRCRAGRRLSKVGLKAGPHVHIWARRLVIAIPSFNSESIMTIEHTKCFLIFINPLNRQPRHVQEMQASTLRKIGTTNPTSATCMKGWVPNRNGNQCRVRRLPADVPSFTAGTGDFFSMRCKGSAQSAPP